MEFTATIASGFTGIGIQKTITQKYTAAKGVAGTAARVVHLEATDYSIVYDGNGANPSFTPASDDANVVRLTAESQGYSSPEYRFTVDGTAGNFSSTATHDITYAGTSFSTSDAKDIVKVEVREGSSGSATAEDSVAIIKVKSGKTSTTTHEKTLWYAQTSNTSSQAAPTRPASAVYNFSSATVTSGLSSWSNNFPGNSYNKLVWAITASPSTSVEVTSTTTSTLSSSDWSPPIIVDKPGDINVIYKYHNSATTAPSVLSSGTNSAIAASRGLSIPTGWYDTPTLALANRGSSSNIFLYAATGTIEGDFTEYNVSGQSHYSHATFAWVWGVAKRIEGQDAYTVVMSNEGHAFPSDSTGAVSSTSGSGTTIEVLRGGTSLTGVLTGEPTADQFKVVASGTNITESSSRGSTASQHAPSSNNGIITYADHTAGTIMSGASNTTASIEYTITISSGDTQQVVTKKQSFTKALAGSPAQNVREPTIFRKNNNSISNTAGTFTNPLQGNGSWGFAVPAITTNGDKVYASSRIFTSDGNAPQQSNWSPPAVAFERIDGQTVTGPAGVGTRQVNLYKLNDSTFSTTTAGSFADPTNGTESGWTFAVPALASNNDKVYVVSRIFTSDGNSPQESSWNGPTIYAQRQDGADAQNQRMPTIYSKQNTINNTSGSFADPLNNNSSNWSFAVPAITANGDIIYASTRIFTSDGQSPQETQWSSPVVAFRRVDGQTITGPAGQSARTVNLYRKNSNTRNATAGTFSNPGQTNVSGTSAWTFDVPALTANGDIVYVMSRTFTSDGQSPQDVQWSTGTVYSRRTDGTNGTSISISSVSPNTPSTGTTRVTFSNGSTMDVDDGQNGNDGDGVDVIYLNASSAPATPSPSSGAPSGWSFTSSTPSSTQRTYVSLGTRSNNSGNYNWGTPSQLTGIDGEDGEDGDDGDNAWSAVCDRPAVFFSEVNNTVTPSAAQDVTLTFSNGVTTDSKTFKFSANNSNNSLTAGTASGSSNISFVSGYGMRANVTGGSLLVKATHSTSGLTVQSLATYVTIKGQ